MHAHGINIFDRTNDNGIVSFVPDDFQFEFFPTKQRFFNQHFRDGTGTKTILQQFMKLFVVVCHRSTGTSQCKRGTDDDRKLYGFQKQFCFFPGMDKSALCSINACSIHHFLKPFTILSFLDRLHLGTDELNTIFLKNPLSVQIHGQIQGCLSTYRWQDGIRFFFINDGSYIFWSDWFNIGSI